MNATRIAVSLGLGLIPLLGLTICPTADAADADELNAVAHAKSLSLAFRRAAERAQPSVVTIVSRRTLEDPRLGFRELLQDPDLRELFPDDPDVPPGSGADRAPGIRIDVGSGVVTDTQGIILTNNHVVADADEVVVRLPDGSELPAEEIRTDPKSDLAIVRVQPTSDLAPARLGDSDKLEIGDWVIAIGSPFELESTVSAGIISGKRRSIRRIERGQLLQTDAAINPGNSGGPLVNLDGEVVGINTAIATSSGGYQGVGFAIPSKHAKWVASELLVHGKVRRAYLGTRIGELTAEASRRFNVAARSGVWVVELVTGSPADEAGVEANDVIVSFGGVPVRSPGDLQKVVEQKPIGSKQQLVVIRKGKRLKLEVTMTELSDESADPAPAEQPE
jgi:serine protease Do